ncbi:MAG: PD40 domain-containing protein [Bryobacteraceae bacterium]|nr:oligogalacturonate lyase family protein [Bryobacterales bacterium]MEB2361214.1 oligogalacturonate lyase family protein [Bryobacterales bacterium]NUN03555.1 PD40 domain-containing protein [Bryobacteraceae bacterium]
MQVPGPLVRGLSRRGLLLSVAFPAFARKFEKKGPLPSEKHWYPDPATEFPVIRLTNPEHSSHLTSSSLKSISRRSDFLLYSSDRTGLPQVFRMDLTSGESSQLTEAEFLDPLSIALMPDEKSFCYFDGPALMQIELSKRRERRIYEVPARYHRRDAALGIAANGAYAIVVENTEGSSRIVMVPLRRGSPSLALQSEGVLSLPLARPGRPEILYRKDDGSTWLMDYTGRSNRKLALAAGKNGRQAWAPDGKTLLYLNTPEDRPKLNVLREFTPETNKDRLIAETSQFVAFARNADASVFVGASANKASPYILLLIRAVRRELAICEHKSTMPERTAPIFSPNSRQVLFESDRHGKPALYTVNVEKLVESTES